MSVRAPAGSMGKTAYNVVLGRGVAAIKGNEFIYQLLVKKDLDGYWKRLSAGSTFESLNSETIFNAEICEPKKSEQERIGAYFETIDKLITLHRCKHFNKNSHKLPIQVVEKGQEITNAWEQRKLGQIGSVAMCKRVFKEQTQEEGDIPFYKIGTFGGQADAYISNELFEEYKEKYPYPQKGDILISASGSIGRTVVFSGKKEYFQDSNIVWLEHGGKIDNTFLRFFYEVVVWEGIEGSTIKRLYNDNILKTKINIPKRVEQAKIGCIFEQLDKLITLHQRE